MDFSFGESAECYLERGRTEVRTKKHTQHAYSQRRGSRRAPHRLPLSLPPTGRTCVCLVECPDTGLREPACEGSGQSAPKRCGLRPAAPNVCLLTLACSPPGVGTRPRTCHLPASPRRLSACAVPAASAHLNQRNGNCLCQLGRCMYLHTAWNRV